MKLGSASLRQSRHFLRCGSMRRQEMSTSSMSEASVPASPSSSIGSNSSSNSRESSPRTPSLSMLGGSGNLAELSNKLTFDQLLALEQLKQQQANQQQQIASAAMGGNLSSQLSTASSSSAAAAAMLTSLLPPPLRSQFAVAIRLAAGSVNQVDTTKVEFNFVRPELKESKIPDSLVQKL